MKLGTLKEVDVRELWHHEQYDFSNWLAKEENIEYLNNILGLTLTDVNSEVYVGAYRCDLVAKDEATGIKVIIENQLERSNHDHLGKIITYASGLDAKVVVWIVTEAREEHRSAIEWLNNNTNSDTNFFLIELHAYKIGDSLPAPMFETIETPNGFIKNSKGSNGNNDLNKTKSERLAFWNEFNDVILQRGKPFNIRKATTDHWYNVAIGSSEADIGINLVNKESSVVVEIYIYDNKKLFDSLLKNKEEIESSLHFKLDWQRLDSKKASRIKYSIKGLNFDDHSNYNKLMNEIIDKVIIMREVFQKYI
ncbi:MAG: DUF4268 domain-containing protein [Clostridia bacterium]|nr:DUF4268 domain-containing protein [Clostridia bacterium]